MSAAKIASPAVAVPVVDARFAAMLGECQHALLLERVYRWEKERANKIFLTQPFRGQIREWTWAEAMNEVRRIANYLVGQGWPRGSRVVILSKNCAYWMMAELAIWMAGHVSVPIYPSLSAHSVRSLLEHCEPVACFIGGVEDKTVGTDGVPSSVKCIRFPTAPGYEGESWESIVANTAPLTASPIPSLNEIATVIYTSGTTGTPKGAMHRFATFNYFVAAGVRAVGEAGDDRMLSYLPLAHIAERALVEAIALYDAHHVFFVDTIETFRTDLKRARPTIFFSVPRLFIKFQQGVLEKLPQRKLERLLRIPIVRRIVQRRILRELGLDAVRIAACGGAPLPMATLKWFRSIGLNLVEGYGMTETGITHTPLEGRSRPGSVGNAAPGVETKIAENGEVLVKSPMNMVGYFKDPEQTEQAFTPDGFFRTGDLGELDSEGWLKIIGRVKEQFKTSKGKYVSPAPIEKLFSMHPDIEGCCVMGAGMPKAFAIVLLSQNARDRAATEEGRRECEASLTLLLKTVNSQVEAHERLAFLVATDEPWTIANGFLTPTMKLKRSVLEKYYAASIADWSSQGTAVVWHTRRAVTT